jgi:hypothetical protein
VGELSSVVRATFNGSIARFGSLRSKATAARQRRHRPHIAVRGQLQRRIGLGTRLFPVPRFDLAQRCCCLI